MTRTVRRWLWWAWVVALLLPGCAPAYRPIVTPTPADVSAWSPCLHVHDPGGVEMDRQFAALASLQAAGRLDWIRTGPNYAARAKAAGLHTIVLLDVKTPTVDHWAALFEAAYAAAPATDIWQIGNELQNIDPDVYVQELTALAAAVQASHPGTWLAAASTTGNRSGPAVLAQYIRAGLLDLPYVAVALNVYSEDALASYRDVFTQHRIAPTHRVFVTETGWIASAEQIAFVRDWYPRLGFLGAERICWYALWSLDGYGLLDNVNTVPTKRPLFQLLETR